MNNNEQPLLPRIVRHLMLHASSTTGIYYYVHKRLNSSCRKSAEKIFDDSYLSNWELAGKELKSISDGEILSNIMRTLPEGDDVVSWNLGLENGCAGVGLQKTGV
jgi:hypothetical protein